MAWTPDAQMTWTPDAQMAWTPDAQMTWTPHQSTGSITCHMLPWLYNYVQLKKAAIIAYNCRQNS